MATSENGGERHSLKPILPCLDRQREVVAIEVVFLEEVVCGRGERYSDIFARQMGRNVPFQRKIVPFQRKIVNRIILVKSKSLEQLSLFSRKSLMIV